MLPQSFLGWIWCFTLDFVHHCGQQHRQGESKRILMSKRFVNENMGLELCVFIVAAWCSRVSTSSMPRNSLALKVGGDGQITFAAGGKAWWWKHSLRTAEDLVLNISRRACIILQLLCIQIMLRYIKSCLCRCMHEKKQWVLNTHTHTSMGTASARCCVTYLFLYLEVFKMIKDTNLYKSSLL